MLRFTVLHGENENIRVHRGILTALNAEENFFFFYVEPVGGLLHWQYASNSLDLTKSHFSDTCPKLQNARPAEPWAFNKLSKLT